MAYSIVEPTADETETEEIEQQMRDLDQVVESFEDRVNKNWHDPTIELLSHLTRPTGHEAPALLKHYSSASLIIHQHY